MDISKEHFSTTGSDERIMMADLHYPSGCNSADVVIYAHGINGFKDWGGMNLIAEAFARESFAFFKFNFSHNGTTPSKPETFDDLEAYGNDNYSIRQEDLKHVIDFVLSGELPFQVTGISLIGHSRGGTDAILYASRDNRIEKLITWAAVSEATTPWRNWDTNKLQDWKDTGVQYLQNSRTNQDMPVYYQLYEDYRKHKAELDVEAAARSIQLPWLIVHGDEDESVFIKEAYNLKEWQPAAEVEVIAHTGHTFDRKHPWENEALPKASKDLVRRSVDFLKGK